MQFEFRMRIHASNFRCYRQNDRSAAQMHAERFPNRREAEHLMFASVHQEI